MKDGEKNMAYSRGKNSNIIVGAAALFVTPLGTQNFSSTNAAPAFVPGKSYKDTLQDGSVVTNVGYTNNGIDITFNPTFGDVMVDQLLDVAKLYKSNMQVTLKTSFAEATLENLLLSLGQKGSVTPGTLVTTNVATVSESSTYVNTYTFTNTNTVIGGVTFTSGNTYTTVATSYPGGQDRYVELLSGDLGDYPIERSLIAVGPGIGATGAQPAVPGSGATDNAERVYVAYRAVSISNVTVSAKRDAATTFDVEFRLLPDDTGSYGKIVDRTY
jgi:hypothetical protein